MARLLAFLFLSILPLVPGFISAILTRAAISLGFGTAVFVGIDIIFDTVITRLSQSTSTIPANILLMIGLVGIDDAFNIMLSAGVTLLTFKGMTLAAGRAAVRNSVWRKPGDTSKLSNRVDWSA